MSFSTAKTVHILAVSFLLLIIYFLFNLSYAVEARDEKKITKIGAIIDENSRIGKEQKAAMKMAAEKFNNQSETHELNIHFRNSSRDPFIAAYAAEHLIMEEKVQVIIGMETWQEAVTVAAVVKNKNLSGDQVVPVISFAAPTITPPLIKSLWPFLIRMGSDVAAQMDCIGDIVSAYYWKRVVVIYEDDGYGGGVGRLAVLSETLRNVGAKIEHRIVLPPLSESADNPYWDEVEKQFKLNNVQSRAFIVLQSSLPTVTGLFRFAKKMGLVGAHSAWIITESVASLLDPEGNCDMEGTLGIKTYYDRNNNYTIFQKEFRTNYSEEFFQDNSEPGIYALRAYDAISIITKAISRSPSSTSLQHSLDETWSNYDGLSGKMQLKENEVRLDPPMFRIINIVDGKTDNELNFWIPGDRFKEQGTNRSSDVVGNVTWPGKPVGDSKGWAMPTHEKKMKILLPVFHGNFASWSVKENGYVGFSIELFERVKQNLSYDILYEFHEYNETNGTYDSMVDLVFEKKYDAVVGDLTVLASRIDKVDFTQPFVESGLSLIVPEKSNESTWLFMKPFTWQMWLATCGILVYTTFIIWCLEGPSSSSPQFDGPSINQIGTATWFTISSLFFAHRERIYSNWTRLVFVVWLFLVLILNSSYQANLSSMLTIERLSPNITDIEMLRTTNSTVGCNSGSFVRKFLEEVLHFDSSKIIELDSNLRKDVFKNKTLSAVFLELPYADIFMTEQKCKGYTNTRSTYSFGGFSFAFQRGSPITRDFSKVFLQLLQDGTMKHLQSKWLDPGNCTANATSASDTPESLRLESFWGIFMISGVTSALCFLSGAILKKYRHQEPSTPTGTIALVSQ